MTDQQYNAIHQDEWKRASYASSAHPEQAKAVALPAVTLETISFFLDFSPDALVIINAAGAIALVNAYAEALFGYSREELVGQPLEMLLPERLRASHASHRTQYLSDPRPRPMGVGLDLMGQRKDGSEFPVGISLQPIRMGETRYVVGSIRDVTERRRLEQVEREAHAEMKARRDVLQLILDRLPTGAFLVQGEQLHLILANQAAQDLWGAEWQPGQSMEDFLTQQGIHLFSEDGRPLLPANTATGRAMASGEAIYQSQVVIRRADGTSHPVLINTLPLEGLSAPMRKGLDASERVVLAVYQDVAALKEAEALKDQFISLATHELRTPVTVVAGYTDMVLKRAARGKEHTLDVWQINKLQEMKQATQQLAKLTEDLLDVTRVQAGQFQLQQRSTDLVALTRQVADRLQATTDDHLLSVRTMLPHLQAMVDPLRIEQVLTNLLNNAIKYSPQGGPVEITLEEDTQTHEANVRIRDYGMGIPREQQAHLFGRFVRAENARAARISGTGLGLYLCREPIERHGGRIWFESHEERGTTFFFTLPFSTGCNENQG